MVVKMPPEGPFQCRGKKYFSLISRKGCSKLLNVCACVDHEDKCGGMKAFFVRF